MSLTSKKSFVFNSGALEDVRTETRARVGFYEVMASAILEEPAEPADFHCILRIPDAQYEVRKSLVYYPGKYFTPYSIIQTF